MYVAPELNAPCDFELFVAERRGIARHEAEALIAGWLAGYDSRGRSLRIPSQSIRSDEGGSYHDFGCPLHELLSFASG